MKFRTVSFTRNWLSVARVFDANIEKRTSIAQQKQFQFRRIDVTSGFFKLGYLFVRRWNNWWFNRRNRCGRFNSLVSFDCRQHFGNIFVFSQLRQRFGKFESFDQQRFLTPLGQQRWWDRGQGWRFGHFDNQMKFGKFVNFSSEIILFSIISMHFLLIHQTGARF